MSGRAMDPEHPQEEDNVKIFGGKHTLLRRTVCYFLTVSLIAAGGRVFAKDQSIDQIRAKLLEIGTGKHANAIVKLKSGNVLKGHIAEQGAQDFTVVSKAGTQRVPYSDVASIKKKRLNVGIKIAIVAGAVVGILVGMMYASCGSGGCH